jgi:hypothetical protein
MKKLGRLFRFTSELKPLYLLIAGLNVLVGLLGLARPVLYGVIVDEVARGMLNKNLSFSRLILYGAFVLIRYGVLRRQDECAFKLFARDEVL